MLTLMTAALAAAQAPQPAQAATVQAQNPQVQTRGQMAPMQSPQHQGMMGAGCPCCRNMGQGEHQRQAPATTPHGQ